MIQVQTKLQVIDNSGAQFAQCIKTLNGFNRTFSYNGDIILVSIKKLYLIRKVKTSEIRDRCFELLTDVRNSGEASVIKW